jgi:O-antigen biosynthesis protein
VIIPSSFAPIGVLQVELSAPLADLQPAAAASGEAFGSARVFARLHGRPLGFVEVPLIEPLPAAQLASAMARTLGGSIARHLADDGLDESLVDLENGVGSVDRPLCLESQRALLVDPRFVSVVVPTVDRPGALRQCLQGLAEQTYPSFEVLVVDNDPDASGAAEVVSGFERQLPGLRRIAEPRRGASRARNRGFAEAAGEIVAFLDGDARPDPSWLAAAVAALVRPANLGSATCVTGAILPAALETEAQLWMEEWGGYSKGFEPRRFDLGAHRPAGPLFPYAIATCGSGASMVLRRSELRALGGFDPALGGGTPARSGEDLALFLDIIASGGTIAYEPSAIVWHQHPETEARFRATMRAYGVGLSAYIVRHVARHPSELLRIAARLPAAAAYFARDDSPRNRRRSPTFPRWIWREELAGMAQGPFAYALGRARLRGDHGARSGTMP